LHQRSSCFLSFLFPLNASEAVTDNKVLLPVDRVPVVLPPALPRLRRR